MVTAWVFKDFIFWNNNDILICVLQIRRMAIYIHRHNPIRFIGSRERSNVF
jgi:hypothetical protein